MKKILLIIILGFIALNLYIKWLESKIVPFFHQISLIENKQYFHELKYLFNGRYEINFYFKEKDNAGNYFRDIDKYFKLLCTIYDNKKNIVFSREYNSNTMEITVWGVRYIDNVDLNLSEEVEVVYDDNEPKYKNPIKYKRRYFNPKYFERYLLEIKILHGNDSLARFNPTIGLFCPDLDDGYFGIQYIVYNLFYVILIIAIFIAYFILRFIIRRIISKKNQGNVKLAEKS
jgi:hypothetical protein